MKSLTVYSAGGKWYGSEIEWARSGSGFYRQTRLIEIPQDPDAIKAFAEENGFKIEWRGPVPESATPQTASASK
jgi:hypothetical protein